MKQAGYTIQDGLADALISSLSMHEAAYMPMEYPGITVGKLYKYVKSTSPDKNL